MENRRMTRSFQKEIDAAAAATAAIKKAPIVMGLPGAIFIGDPIGDKPVTDISGVNMALGKKMASKGFDKAYVLLGQYLILKRNKQSFVEWLNEEFEAKISDATLIHDDISEWCFQFLYMRR